MNPIHSGIIAYIRDNINDKLAASFADLTDEQIVRRMFANYRSSKGLRLTNFGLQLMRQYFQGYRTLIPDDEHVRPMHLIFLDQHARLPYFCNANEIVVFDRLLGIKLQLIEGRLSTLVEIGVDE